MDEEQYLALSGIQHFAFCRRQWALIHIEQQWNENFFTAEGSLMHKRAHDEGIREHRGNIITIRGLYVHSHALRISGVCDVVEFHANAAGHPLHGEQGLWLPYPIEYKRGKSKSSDVDRLQLCAQAICLEEMFGSDITEGALYYGETHSREIVPLDAKLRSQVSEICKEMHTLYQHKHTPKCKETKTCRSCSLKELCQPKTAYSRSVQSYLKSHLKEIEL